MKQEIIVKLKKLTKHNYLELVQRGNKAILAAFQLAQKEVLIPSEGGWITYQQYPKKLNLKLTELKTKDAVLDLEDLKVKSKKADLLIYQNPGGYFAEQPYQEIYKICKKNNCLVVLDVSGCIGTDLCDGNYADIMLSSFGKWKLVEAQGGGFISCQDQRLFNQLKLKPLEEKNKLKKILVSLEKLNSRIMFLLSKREQILEDLKEFEILHPKDLGFVVVVKYKLKEEKNKLIRYCKKNNLEYTECPRYIRVNEIALSIELKRLFVKDKSL